MADVLWEVVGGVETGGLIVREGQVLDSPQLPVRLANGALVSQLDIVGNRLRFQRVTGEGPDRGWVTTRLKGKDLLQLTSKWPTDLAHKAGWRLYALSDLHVDYPENRAWVESLPLGGHEDDALILAGDVSHSAELVRWTLQQFQLRFAHVFYCVGNHELWVKRSDAKMDGAKEFAHSIEKFDHLMLMARELGVVTDAKKLGTGNGALWVVPLQSWYKADFGQPDEELKEQARKLMTDFHQTVWPAGLGPTPDDVADYFDEMNDALDFSSFDAPVVSFSHFLPRLELLPAKMPEHMKLLIACVGTRALEDRIRRLDSKIHVFGHSHVNWYTHWNGVHYIQNAIRYPRERKGWKTRVDVCFDEGISDPMSPFLVWNSDSPENFCLQPERCGRGCPQASAQSANFANRDSKVAAEVWDPPPGGAVNSQREQRFRVREGQQCDLAFVEQHLLASIDPDGGGDFVASLWPWWFRNPACHIRIAEVAPSSQSEGLVGMAVLQKINKSEGWIMGVRVRQSVRRAGVASMLLRDVDRRAGSLSTGSVDVLRMATSSSNTAMLRLTSRLGIEVAGRFAFVTCSRMSAQGVERRRLEVLTPEEAWPCVSKWPSLATVGALYQPSIGQFTELTEASMRIHARGANAGQLIGLRESVSGKLGGRIVGVAIIVPGAPGTDGTRARVIAFAAGENDRQLVALLELVWSYPLPYAEPNSPITGYLPLCVCALVESGDVHGWTRPRSTEEIVFAWRVGHLAGSSMEHALACKDGSEMIKQARWAVVGRGSNATVEKLLAHLKLKGRDVRHVDPYGASGSDVPASLADLPADLVLDVVDLCANPTMFGKKAVEDCKARGINNIFIQPGAGSIEIEDSCEAAGIAFHNGCVLVEM